MTLAMAPANPLVQGPGNADLANALIDMKMAAPGYQKAETYYEGNVPEIFASNRVRRMLRRWGMSFNFNFAKTPVDAVTERLKITSITTEDDAQNAMIQALMDTNQFALQSTNIMKKACTFGDGYILVWPHATKEGVVNLIYKDPRLVRLFYDEANPLEVKFAINRWQVGRGLPETNPNQQIYLRPGDQPPIRIDLYYPNRIERYVSKKGTKGTLPTDFVPYHGDEDDDGDEDWVGGPVLPNPFGQVPLFHFKGDADDYGTPEHKGFYPIQDMIHKVINGFAVVIDYQMFPQRYALLMEGTDSSEPAELDEGQFDIDSEPDGRTVPITGEARSQLSADPASLWYMSGVSELKQLDPADPKTFTGPIGDLITWGAQITTTPLNRFSPGGNPASGESLKIMDAPFVNKIDTRKLSFGDTWKRVFEFALKVLGVADPTVTVNWAPSATSDNLTDWQVAKAKQDSGVPVSTTLMENGYADDQVKEWMAQGQADLPQRLSNLVSVGEFLGSASTAVAAGVVSAEQVQAILTSVMGDLNGDPADATE